jgi:tetratricopeptide (TPR) repeat protein
MSGFEESERALALADEAFSRFDVDAMVAHLSAAVRGFTAAGDKCRAAMACVRLGDTLANAMGNLTAARAWFVRARRLVEDEPPCLEQGWVAVAAMGCDVDDPAELLTLAELALDRARRFGDVNLETKALADAGLAHVQVGRIARGMALLDEAMALACGPADDTATAGKSVCSFFTACYFSADFERAASWAELLRRHGLIGPERGGRVFLSSHCDAVHAALLVELGRWGDAEALLTRAKADFERVMGMPSWHPDIALADLRIRQGRLAEAEELLLGKDQAVQALLPAARLHLARGDLDLARATARRGLRGIGGDRLRAAELLAVLADSELARGDLAAATEACAELTQRIGDLDVPVLQARSGRARARVLAAGGDLGGAIAALETVVDGIDASQLPWLRATLLLDLARWRDAVGDRAGAGIDAKAAAALLGGLDVVVEGGDVALLERLVGSPSGSGVSGAGAAAPASRTAELAREGKGWVASYAGRSVRLRDTKGLRYLAVLVASPGVERHALDLVDRVEGVAASGGVDRRALGDAGNLLDGRARTAYRHRIEQLRSEADDALAAGRLETAEACQAELDQLVAQLSAAFGLGGRDRRASSAVERARLNVTRALRAAIASITEALPDAGRVLDRCIRTGLYCTYVPEADDGIRWIVQSPLNGTAAD